jgi:hypothetical protein
MQKASPRLHLGLCHRSIGFLALADGLRGMNKAPETASHLP